MHLDRRGCDARVRAGRRGPQRRSASDQRSDDAVCAGRTALPGQAWTVIARAGIVAMIRKRTFLGLLLFAWMPFLVRAVQIYVTSNYPQVAMFAPTAETFRQFLEQQDFFVFIMTIYAAAGLIANVRRPNA